MIQKLYLISWGTQNFSDSPHNCKGCAAVILLLEGCIPSNYIQQWLPIRHHHPYFKDREVMFEEMKWLAPSLPISKHRTQETPVYWVLKNSKNSWHFVSIRHTSSYLNFTTWWTGYYGYFSPLQKKIESQQNCHLPVILQFIVSALIPGK